MTAAKVLAAGGAVAAAGMLSAQAFAQVGLPGVTVTVPTVPIPLPTPPPPPVPAPLPPLPPAPTPPPPPAVSVPSVSVPAVPTPAPTPTPSAPAAPSDGATPSAGTTPGATATAGGGSSTWSYTRARPSSPSEPARVTGIQADAWRASPRGKRPRATTITYTLSAPARVRFLVRGPAPSCRVVARFTVRGHAGKNRLRFTGKIGRRRLEPGTYRLVADTGKGRPSRPVAVVVGNGRVDRATCARRDDPAVASAVFEALTTAFGSALPGNLEAPAAKSAKRGGVLPAIRERVQQLPDVTPEAVPGPAVGGISDPQGLPAWLLGLAIPLAGLLGIVLGASAVGYVRRRSVYY